MSRSPRHDDGLCPHCRLRPKEEKRSYCPECRRELQREWNVRRKAELKEVAARSKRPSPSFRELMYEARQISMQHCRDMGYIGRTVKSLT